MARIERQMTLELNREPTDEELSKKMGISPDKIREVLKIMTVIFQLCFILIWTIWALWIYMFLL